MGASTPSSTVVLAGAVLQGVVGGVWTEMRGLLPCGTTLVGSLPWYNPAGFTASGSNPSPATLRFNATPTDLGVAGVGTGPRTQPLRCFGTAPCEARSPLPAGRAGLAKTTLAFLRFSEPLG